MRLKFRQPIWYARWVWAMFWLTRRICGAPRAWEWLREEVRK